MLQTQEKTSSKANATSTTATTQKSDKKSQLRGMSFEEGTKALSPDGALGQKDAKDDPKKVEKPNPKGPPVEIEALGLKHVKVDCTLEAWDALSLEERANVITFLTKKDADCEGSKKLKSSKVTISMGRKIKSADEKGIADQQKKADDNGALMKDGKGPKGDKTIGVKEGDVTTTQSQTTKVTEVPVKETKVMKEHFDAAGSTFDSADYKPEDMQQGGVIELLDQAAEQIRQYLALDPNAKITLNVIASESHVTNPAQFKEPGSLAAARAANGVELAKAHFAALGIPLANVGFATTNLGANGPKWDSKAGISKHDPMYTEHQFVRLEVAAEVEVEGDESEKKTETETTETKTQDVQLVKMNVDDNRKKTRGGNNSFTFTKNQKAPRRHPIKKFFKGLFKKTSTSACPSF